MTTGYVPIFGNYSFMDVTATITGPGANGVTIAGPQVASAEEGVTIALGEETNTQTIGADGAVMNSLHASRAGTITIRLLKTSPTNKVLQKLYNDQRKQSSLWGRNIITIRDVARNDTYTAYGCAFVRFPSNSYAKVGNTIEWEIHASVVDADLGDESTVESEWEAQLQNISDFGGNAAVASVDGLRIPPQPTRPSAPVRSPLR
jgi:hypothetical protein